MDILQSFIDNLPNNNDNNKDDHVISELLKQCDLLTHFINQNDYNSSSSKTNDFIDKYISENIKSPDIIFILDLFDITNIKWPLTLRSISFREDFNEDISYINWPEHLYILELGEYFNHSISNVCWPKYLHKLYLGDTFDHDITNVIFPESLQILELGSCYSHNITNIKWPSELQNLHIANATCILPKSLRSLTSGNAIAKLNPTSKITSKTTPINPKIEWPTSLCIVTLSYSFNQDINFIKWPLSLRELYIEYDHDVMFHKNIMSVADYKFFNSQSSAKIHNVEKLRLRNERRDALEKSFNEPGEHVINLPQGITILSLHHLLYNNILWPTSLTVLIFGYSFDSNISHIELPSSILTLQFGCNYNQILPLQLPINLQTLTFGDQFNQQINEIESVSLLEVIEFGFYFNQSLTNIIFHAIYTIIDHSCKITLNSCAFPKTLHKIIHVKSKWHKTIIYERKIGQFTKGTQTLY
jgi:hypothetical protein